MEEDSPTATNTGQRERRISARLFLVAKEEGEVGGASSISVDDGVTEPKSHYSNQNHRRSCDIFRGMDKEMAML